MSLVIVKKVKDLFKEKGLKTSGEAIEVINQELRKLCLKAADQVIEDKLKTVKGVHVPKLDGLLETNRDGF